MNVLPLVAYELRAALRRPSTYRIRMGCAVGAMAVAIWSVFIWSAWRPLAAVGKSYFETLALLGFSGSVFAGLILAADSFSQEKREGTLGLLFLTDLTAGEVVLGKLIAKAVVPIYGLLGVVPTLAVTVLYGGITAGEFARMFLVWSNALIFALALSLWTSAFCWQSRTAHLSAACALLLVVGAVPFLGLTLSASARHPAWGWLSALLSPVGPYRLAFATTYRFSATGFWAALVVNQALSAICLAWAARRLARIRTESHPTIRTDLRSVWPPRTEKRENFQLLESKPVEWLEQRRSRGQLELVSVLAAMTFLLLVVPVDPFATKGAQMGFLLWFVVQIVFKLWVAGNAVHAFTPDRQSGALESLLGTKVDVPEITAGTFSGFRRHGRAALWILGIQGVLLTLRLLLHGSGMSALVVLALTAAIPWDAYCLVWVGLFQGLVARSPAVAFLTTLFRMVLLPWFWFLMATQLFWQSSRLELVVLWLLIVAVNQLIFMANAKASLLRHFRVLALKPFAEKKPHIESEWSAMNWELE
jgi:hypothetical protein